jgi:cytochrome oxidase Cu insertion factor (SCO1/SenC/PrrC family)
MLQKLRQQRSGGGALQIRWPLLAVVLALALGALIGVGALLHGQLQERAGAGTVDIGGPFRLTNQYGERVTPKDFAGKYMMIYFGYTYCPDICPMTLANMTQALDQLPEAMADKVVPIFVTVDPERDTVEQLSEYAPLFHPRLVALTGTDAEVKAAARAYRVYFGKVEDASSGDYLMDHSSFVYLMGPDGAYVTHFGHSATPDDMAEALKREVSA